LASAALAGGPPRLAGPRRQAGRNDKRRRLFIIPRRISRGTAAQKACVKELLLQVLDASPAAPKRTLARARASMAR